MLELEETTFQGSPISQGIGIGSPIFFAANERVKKIETIRKSEVNGEVARFLQALTASREDFTRLQKKSPQDSEIVSILDTQLQMLDDPILTEGIEKKIRAKNLKVESIFYELIEEYQDRLSTLTDIYFQERVRDLIDLFKRILDHLYPSNEIKEVPEDSIILACELSPSETIEANVRAFVTESGGLTSHAAIIARAKGIPYVANIDLKQMKDIAIQLLIVDGSKGLVILNPESSTISKYQKIQEENRKMDHALKNGALAKGETIDGFEVRIFANLENPCEIDQVLQSGAEGVGLFRSEYLCMAQKAFPSEEQQYEIYKGMVLSMQGKPLVIRLFDLGGDKNIEGAALDENNPALGCRAIRFLLRHPDLMRAQLRAIIRASAFGEVHILIPMISDIAELQVVRREMGEIKAQLEEVGCKNLKAVPLGCMIEVPSSAIMSDAIVKEADFLSIGTNDLIQYVLAADRVNPYTSDLYFTSHPSILRLIKTVVSHANEAQKSVILCGELAADPKMIPILLGFGIFEFSVAARHIPLVKHTIRKWKIVEACRLAESALAQGSVEELKNYLFENLNR